MLLSFKEAVVLSTVMTLIGSTAIALVDKADRCVDRCSKRAAKRSSNGYTVTVRTEPNEDKK